MVFELKVLLFNVLLPAAIALVATIFARWIGRGAQGSLGSGKSERQEDPEAPSHGMSRSIKEGIKDEEEAPNRRAAAPASGTSFEIWCGAVAAVAGIWLAFALRNEFQFWSEDSWMRVTVGTALVGLMGAISGHFGPGTAAAWAKWIVRIAAALTAAWIVFPKGEAWDFLKEKQVAWILAISMLAIIPWWLLNWRTKVEAATQSLGWIFCVAALAFLTAQSFMRVTEPLLAVASVFGVFGLGTYWLTSLRALDGAAGPALFAMTAAGANAQFNSYLGLSDWLTWTAMGAPAIAAAISQLAAKRAKDSQATSKLSRKQILITLGSCLIMAAVVIVWTQISAGGGEEEW